MTTAILIGEIIAGIAVCPLLHWLGARRGQPGCCPAATEAPRESEIRASQARLQVRIDIASRERAGAEGRERALSTAAGGRPAS